MTRKYDFLEMARMAMITRWIVAFYTVLTIWIIHLNPDFTSSKLWKSDCTLIASD